MSKSQQKSTYNTASGQVQTNTSNEAAANAQLQGVLGTAQQNTSNLYPAITGGYGDVYSTGGYDPGALTTITNDATNLATTGGVTPAQVGALQDESAAAAASAYKTAGAEAQRRAAITGGYGEGGAIDAYMARQASNAGSAAAQQAIGTITPMIQQGEIAGAGILNTTQQNMAANKLAALGGTSNIYGLNDAQVTATLNQILTNYNQTGQLNANDIKIMAEIANSQKGLGANLLNIIQTLGGVASGIMGSLPQGGGGGGGDGGDFSQVGDFPQTSSVDYSPEG